MALPGVYITDTDGNIGTAVNSVESVCGMVFDYSKLGEFAFAKKDSVLELTSAEDMKTLGIDNTVISGIPAYHIDQFFTRRGGSGRLFVLFADCSENFDAIEKLQRNAHGLIYQVSVWTQQALWGLNTTPGDGDVYTVNLLAKLNATAEVIANKMNAPLSILLYANTTKVDCAASVDESTYGTPVFNRIPSLLNANCRYVSVMLGDSNAEAVKIMREAVGSNVGACGADLATLANNSVPTCIGYVGGCDYSNFIPGIVFGFGNDATPYENVTVTNLEDLDSKGYNFFMKYEGDEVGVYRNFDNTCTKGDYRTIARNRTIGKVRRLVRAAILPMVNKTVAIDPSTGLMSSAAQAGFVNAVRDVLQTMTTNLEISGATIPTITQTASLLQTDQVYISFSVVPVGVSKAIFVSESLSLSNS